MKTRTFVIALLHSLFAASMISAQQVYTPERGSAERKAILDTLRVPVERELKQKVVFVADQFNVQGTWAFVGGTLQNAEGGEPNWSITPYAEAKEEGFFDNNYFALLRKTAGKWKVTSKAVGCTDVCYADWWRRYRAPKAIFPYTE